MKLIAEERDAARLKQSLERYAGGTDAELAPPFNAELERLARLRRWQVLPEKR